MVPEIDPQANMIQLLDPLVEEELKKHRKQQDFPLEIRGSKIVSQMKAKK